MDIRSLFPHAQDIFTFINASSFQQELMRFIIV